MRRVWGDVQEMCARDDNSLDLAVMGECEQQSHSSYILKIEGKNGVSDDSK